MVLAVSLLSMWSAAVGEVKELPHEWANITIHITKVAICCVYG